MSVRAGHKLYGEVGGGGGSQIAVFIEGGGGASEVLPLQKEGAEKVVGMLKGE